MLTLVPDSFTVSVIGLFVYAKGMQNAGANFSNGQMCTPCLMYIHIIVSQTDLKREYSRSSVAKVAVRYLGFGITMASIYRGNCSMYQRQRANLDFNQPVNLKDNERIALTQYKSELSFKWLF